MTQPEYSDELKMLCDCLKMNGLSNPYENNNVLFGIKCFKEACNGMEFKCNSPYLYSYSKFKKIQRLDLGWNFSRIPDFESLKRKSNNDWYALNKVLSGNLPTRRNFTWFTPNELKDSTNIIEDLYKLGLPNEWIEDVSPVILRCDLKLLKLDSIKKPTSIDGFHSPIFLPVSKSRMPKALNLNDTNNFANGHTEILIKDIPTKAIEVLPLDFNVFNGKSFNKENNVYNNSLKSKLLRFYKSN